MSASPPVQASHQPSRSHSRALLCLVRPPGTRRRGDPAADCAIAGPRRRHAFGEWEDPSAGLRGLLCALRRPGGVFVLGHSRED
jgi:hypothetical protein